MKKTEQRKKLGMRAVSLVALASLVLAIVLMPLEAEAVTSLSGIEQIKSRGGTFTILEIVPQEGTGSIGYYVSGQEPTANWKLELASKTSRTERANYANTLSNNLKKQGIMGAAGTAADAYPLTQIGDGYQEAYPWETLPSGAVELKLMAEESTTAKGGFETAEGGSYEQTTAYDYELGGSYVENADYYVYGTSGETGTYYYALTFQFAHVDESSVDRFFGVPLYTYVPETGTEAARYAYAGTLRENSSDFTIDLNTTYYTASVVPASPLTNTWESFVQVTVTDGAFDAAAGTVLYTRTGDTASYQVAGTVGDAAFTPVEGTVYYKVSNGASPVSTGTEPVETVLHSYYARKNSTIPYREKASGETGYFKQIVGYRYVGAGNGSLNFVPNAGGTAQTVVTDRIYMSGGYVNNNWFERYVLDMDEAELSSVQMDIQVWNYTPEQIPSGVMKAANLVVVSAGFDLSSGNTVPYTQDITAEQRDALAQKPRVVDAGIRGTKSNLASLGDGTAPCVTANNVYYFKGDTSSAPDARPALITDRFHTKFDNTDPYQVVLDEITYENQLRTPGSGVEPLTKEASMATCIRYIINTHRAINIKKEIKVLDIEPASIYDQTDNIGPLTEAKVRSWLPASANNSASEEYIETIEITHMSTAALVGKIEDINEEYDLIYIGASLEGLNTRNSNGKAIVDYNDNSMDGLIYTNIGDTYTTDTILEGLLEKDYDIWYGEIQAVNNSKTYRFSGNDITPKKQAELVEFANAGLPIVVADDLTLRGTSQPKKTLSVSITRGSGTTLTADPYVKSDDGTDYTRDYSYQYQWYRWEWRNWGGWTWVPISNDKIITGSAGYRYYCQVTAVSASGDSYTARSETVRVTYGSPKLEQDSAGKSNSFKLALERTGEWWERKKLSVILPSGWTGVDYQWQYRSNRQWYNVSNNGKDQSLSNLWYNTTYSCLVTYGGVTYRTESMEDNGDRGNPNEPGNVTLTLDVTQNAVQNGIQLTASLSPVMSASYWWCRDRGYGQPDYYNTNQYTVTDTSGNYKYYCWARIDYDGEQYWVKSPTYKLTTELKVETVDARRDAVIPAVAASDGLNTARIDKCSLLYAALDSVWSKENVISEGEVKTTQSQNAAEQQAVADRQNTLVKYLNLSRPKINLTASPTEYNGISDLKDGICDGTLSFTFTIDNPTDPTPSETKYLCKLYIDQNGDGRHTEDEEIGDLWISGGTENGQLSANTDSEHHEYTVMRTLSKNQFSGMVAWKLQVVKVGDNTVHASKKGYTYIHPDTPTPINILQVRDSSVNLQTDSQMQALYAQISGAYALNVTSITVDELNEYGKPDYMSNDDYTPSKETISQYLTSFDMLIIGFGDCYGDFEKNTADAVVDYIDTGKSILFTHDTTSFRNLPSGIKFWSEQYPTYNNHRYWGYYFNTILRDKVGLDRYGVTNTTYGLTKYFGQGTEYTDSSKVSGPVANGYTGASSQKLAEIKSAGYSIAYQPDSSFDTVDETQGYTKYTLARFRDNNVNQLLPTTGYGSYSDSGGNNTTENVSQVNQGQITQFPFKLEKEMKIAWTHDQYYQLNMNSDDIVVWYCLAGNNFANGKNDVTNSYYIYNRGNVTYSGAGHSEYLGADEAKLFVNTMVAAYRAGNGNPTVNYLTSDGSSDLSVQLIPVEYSSSANSNTSSLNGNQTVYFKITDPNLTTRKTMTVDFFYEADAASGGVADAELGNAVVKQVACGKIYRVSDGDEVSKTALRSNVLYKTDIPSAVLTAFDASGLSEMKLYIKTTTTISGNAYTGYDVLTMKKLGLLRLE